MEILEDIALKIEKAYEELQQTIDSIGKLKNVIKDVVDVTTDFKKIFDNLLTDSKLNEFQKLNNDATNQVKQRIDNIEKSINDILEKRLNFIDTIQTYDDRFKKFENMVQKENEILVKLDKNTKDYIAKLENNLKNIVSKQVKVNNALGSVEAITKYDELISAIKENTRLLKKLELANHPNNKTHNNNNKNNVLNHPKVDNNVIDNKTNNILKDIINENK